MPGSRDLTMKKIGLISDTHGYLHPSVLDFFKECDEIWHAGDAGSIAILDQLSAFKPLKAVYGNIDGWDVRVTYPEFQLFDCEEVKILMIHIGGYPGRYAQTARKLIQEHKPGLFISGHSHILKVIYDDKNNLLHINPGAAGNHGLHKKVTAVRFIIEGKEIKDMEIYETSRKAK